MRSKKQIEEDREHAIYQLKDNCLFNEISMYVRICQLEELLKELNIKSPEWELEPYDHGSFYEEIE